MPELSPEPFTLEMTRYGKELFKFSVRQFKKFLGPGVYVAKAGDEFLYVGSSKNLFSRTSEKTHSALQAAMEVEGCEIWILLASSEMNAREMETYLIAENQPRFNKVGKSANNRAYRHIQEWYPEFTELGVAGIIKAQNG